MSWYAAHIIMYVKRKEKSQRRFPVWENIVLIEAASDDAAFAKAEQHGKLGEGDDGGSFRWGGKPAAWVFAGVRKVVECVDPETRPGDGTEVSYSELELASEKDVKKLVANKPVPMSYNETFRDANGSQVIKTTTNGRKNARTK